jgi:hypothetical protein
MGHGLGHVARKVPQAVRKSAWMLKIRTVASMISGRWYDGSEYR